MRIEDIRVQKLAANPYPNATENPPSTPKYTKRRQSVARNACVGKASAKRRQRNGKKKNGGTHTIIFKEKKDTSQPDNVLKTIPLDDTSSELKLTDIMNIIDVEFPSYTVESIVVENATTEGFDKRTSQNVLPHSVIGLFLTKDESPSLRTVRASPQASTVIYLHKWSDYTDIQRNLQPFFCPRVVDGANKIVIKKLYSPEDFECIIKLSLNYNLFKFLSYVIDNCTKRWKLDNVEINHTFRAVRVNESIYFNCETISDTYYGDDYYHRVNFGFTITPSQDSIETIKQYQLCKRFINRIYRALILFNDMPEENRWKFFTEDIDIIHDLSNNIVDSI